MRTMSVLFLLLLLIAAIADAAGIGSMGGNASVSNNSGDAPVMVGGPCEYDLYNGTATICSVMQTSESAGQTGVAGGPGYAGYEVRYEFTPAEDLPVWVFDYLNRSGNCSLLLQLCNSWYPGPEFLEKYNITEGAVFNATLRAIRAGTCTPVLIELDGVDRCDYFESGSPRTS
ncbi:MAG TPA: hypothetical protein PK659_08050 [Methanothrix sp.]|nr:hypothetical protein [Methanothrix sp.]HOK58890.1 hypothetical protein [Methanothrix sp.]HOL44186.1 hypothetical protein [Methanothrix sp.]HPO89151.1 hypothetical protein [Methanothrix sp.]